MAVTGISNLVLLIFSILAIVFILALTTPFFKGLTNTVGVFLGSTGAEKLSNGLLDTVKQSKENPSYATNYYRITLGRGFYFIGIWQGSGFGTCPSGAFCVIYFAPNSNVTKIINAIKSGNTENVTVVKSVVSFYQTDYTVTKINGDDISHNIGVIAYVDGIKSTVWGISSYYDTSNDRFSVSITAIRGVSYIKVVKK